MWGVVSMLFIGRECCLLLMKSSILDKGNDLFLSACHIVVHD
jgi:hypothetical protein